MYVAHVVFPLRRPHVSDPYRKQARVHTRQMAVNGKDKLRDKGCVGVKASLLALSSPGLEGIVIKQNVL